VYPIIGNRYKCTTCHDFDFCDDCEDKYGSSHIHPLIKYRASSYSKGIEFQAPKQLKIKKRDFSLIDELTKNLDNQIKKVDKIFFVEDLLKMKKVEIPQYEKNKQVWALKQLKDTYNLGKLTDDQILTALVTTKGNIDEALVLLFQ